MKTDLGGVAISVFHESHWVDASRFCFSQVDMENERQMDGIQG
jgi:hypothetical protein